MAERKGNDLAGCGYGLLGLCCASCLSGPCRLSPFDGETAAGACGAGGDWIVAHNLRERVLVESLRRMAGRRQKGEGDPEAVQARLSPAAAFPTLHSLGMPRGTWMAALVEAAAGGPAGQRKPEALLAEALSLSAFALAAGELAQDPGGPEIALPTTPAPLLVVVAEEGEAADPSREALLKGIEAACAETARTFRLAPGGLAAFGRAVYAAWGTPLAFTRSTAVVASPSAVPGLGALGMGFSLLPIPGYPIRGSRRVEGYLTGGMKEAFGHGLLAASPEEEVRLTVLRSLRP